MWDNIKFYILNKEEFEKHLNKTEKIDLQSQLNIFTGELLEYPKTGKFLNMDVRITSEHAFIKGSIHKFTNAFLEGTDQNHNDFDIRDFNFAAEELISSLQIDPEKTSVTNLEFGLNIKIDEDPKTIVMHNLIMFNFRDHNRKLNFRGKGDYKEYELSDYLVKIYNKSKQYNLDEHVLRVEIKFTNKRVLGRLGINTLNDLKDLSVYLKVFEFFMSTFDKLQIIDDFSDRKDIPQRDKNRLNLLTNPNFWTKERASQMKETLKREFNSLAKKYRLDSMKRILQSKLEDKFLELIRLSPLKAG